jgi:hypothetical protein
MVWWICHHFQPYNTTIEYAHLGIDLDRLCLYNALWTRGTSRWTYLESPVLEVARE